MMEINNKKDLKINSSLRQVGSSTLSSYNREENDFYATEPIAVELLLEKEQFGNKIWEVACGKGHISEVLINHGYDVKSTDLIDRGYSRFNGVVDMLDIKEIDCDVITNPPYHNVVKYVEHLLNVTKEGRKIALFLKIQFLESKSRYEFFKKYPPYKIYVASSRLNCARGGKFEDYKSTAVCYAWFVWIKGNKELPTLDWIIKKDSL